MEALLRCSVWQIADDLFEVTLAAQTIQKAAQPLEATKA
jgi:hypothetical protein